MSKEQNVAQQKANIAYQLLQSNVTSLTNALAELSAVNEELRKELDELKSANSEVKPDAS